MPKYEIYDRLNLYADQYGGAVYINEKWQPFAYFYSGDLDIFDEYYATEIEAYGRYKEIFT